MYDVLKYINENLKSRLTLEETAERFAYSKWYFCEAFKKFAGITFTDYVRHRRMQLAASEVMEGKKFTDIAQDCGYDTQTGFNKAFLREYGCLPGEFKKDEQFYRKQYEERRKMYSVSDRCEILKRMTIEERPDDLFKSAQRDFYYLKGAYKGYEEERTMKMLSLRGFAR